VYEAKPTPSGLNRNIAQCLEDYHIPLYLSHTITRVLGSGRVEGVEIAEVDDKMNPIPGTERVIECDGIILSVGLIPENEIAQSLKINIDKGTKGPLVDQNFMTMLEGAFSCGNALHVNDLVDYVSESGEYAGDRAAYYSKVKEKRNIIPVSAPGSHFLYVVPQYINIESDNKNVVFYFRSREVKSNVSIVIKCNDKILFSKKYAHLKPPEMERIEISLSDITFSSADSIDIIMLEE